MNRLAGFDGAAQPPTSLHPILALRHQPHRIGAKLAVQELIVEDPSLPGSIIAARQIAQIAQEIRIRRARFFGLIDQLVQLVDKALQLAVSAGRRGIGPF